MHKRPALAFVLPLLLALGCNRIEGSGHRAEETRTVGPFTKIAVHNGMQLKVTVGQPASVKVWGDDNLVPKISTTVTNGELVLEMKDRVISLSTQLGLHADITVPKLDGLSASGGSSIEAQPIDTTTLALQSSGGSRLTVGGHCTTLTVDASGGSTISAEKLSCTSAAIALSGGTRAQVNATGELTANLSGGSTAAVLGHPTIKSKELSGGSSLALK